MKSIYIVGANGFFGQKFVKYFKNKNWQVFTDRIDITNYPEALRILSQTKPDVVFNCAGITGKPNVDWCENNKEITMQVNLNGALNLAYLSQKLGFYFAHLGSGCVYAGDNNGIGFRETDEANFEGSYYSRTKKYSEILLTEFNPLQLRVRIPLEGKSSAKNVINKLLNYEKIVVVNNSFTVVEDFLDLAYFLISNQKRGIYNCTNPGYMDYKFLLTEYQKIVDKDKKFEFISPKELDSLTLAKRSNCVLNTDKITEEESYFLPEIKSRVPSILKKYKESLI
jgi:dTDP-4-dehydrorhamnose reductase